MIIAFRKTANRWWAILSDGKQYLVSYVFNTRSFGWVVELERAVEGNFCEAVSAEVKVPEELIRR